MPARPGSSRRRTLASEAAVAVTGVGGRIGAWVALDQGGNSANGPAGDRTSPGSPPADTGGSTSAGSPASDTDGTTQAGTTTSGTSATATRGKETPARRAIGKTADVPVGGGRIFAQENVVVTQSEQGSFRAFSARCPHAGCRVATIRDGTIGCPCHGSSFDIADGSVLGGPATTGLPASPIEIRGDDIMLVADA